MKRGARSSEPPARLVRFEAMDGVTLSGLLYEAKNSTKAITWLHGTGGASVFDSKRTNELARAFTSRGFTFFPFNNRGAHIVRSLRGRLGGMAYEQIRDCV